jgi:hypothetical protein
MSRPLILFTALAIACTTDDGTPGAFPAEPLTAALELRVGSADDPELAFTWFRDLEVGPDGRIYTLHPQEHAIRMHDANGAFLGSFGRAGEGPGEFDSPSPMGLLGDTLWVLDHGRYRFSFFDLDGQFLGSRVVPIDLGTDPNHPPPRPTGLLADGTIAGASPAWSHLVASGDIDSSAVLRLDSSGSTVDTIAAYSVANTAWEVRDPNDERSMRLYRQQPFSDTELVTVSRQVPRVVRVDRRLPTGSEAPALRVTALTLDGDTVFARAYSYTPIPIEAALVDSIIENLAASMSRAQFPGAPTRERAAEWARRSLLVPAYHPPVTQLLVGRDGSVWLCAERTGGPTAAWRVLSPDGDPLGVVQFPARFVPLLADGDLVWGSEYDELDVPYIVRYRVGGRHG